MKNRHRLIEKAAFNHDKLETRVKNYRITTFIKN
jgi:hypothetical protein